MSYITDPVQARKDAIERIKSMDTWCDPDTTPTAADYLKALLWDLRAIDRHHIEEALIDLLSDEQDSK